mmetsp:Transcript_20197/g.43695  ORF Transcript_20197/g.43695 Transcript_20197/m.43695 type:complete len:112 (-) Transcript_20197:58-393(-)
MTYFPSSEFTLSGNGHASHVGAFQITLGSVGHADTSKLSQLVWAATAAAQQVQNIPTARSIPTITMSQLIKTKQNVSHLAELCYTSAFRWLNLNRLVVRSQNRFGSLLSQF